MGQVERSYWVASRLSELDLEHEMAVKDGDFIRVGAGASAEKVAGVIAAAVQSGKEPTLRAVGASAVNQMVKACAIAMGYVAPQGRVLLFRPGFATVPDRDDATRELTCITMKVIVDE